MTITFISAFQAFVWFVAAMVALWLYVRRVRPFLVTRPEFHEFYALSDTWRNRAVAWLKLRWDLTVSALLMASPSIWNGLLDLMIWLSLTLSDVLPVLAGMDLSSLLLPGWLEIAIRFGAAFLPYARARWFGDE